MNTAGLPVGADIGGGKAASLARLAILGLPVPQGFVCTDALFRTWVQQALGSTPTATDEAICQLRAHMQQATFPDVLQAEIADAVRALGAPRFAVRSSFALEDEPNTLAAGVFESVVDIAEIDVLQAVRKVLLSAISPAAIAYVRARGRDPLQGPMAVLIHAFVQGESAGHAAAGPQTTTVWQRQGSLSPQLQAELRDRVQGVMHHLGPSELEWVCHNDAFVFLQWRPFTESLPAPPWRPSESNYAESTRPSDEWIWDATHNPRPVSPAQEGLVALVQQHCNIGYDQAVFGGYLFYRPNAARAPLTILPDAVDEAFSGLQRQVESDLVRLPQTPDLESALALFTRHYERLVGTIGAAVREGRQRCLNLVNAHAPDKIHLLKNLWAFAPSKASQRQALLQQVTSAPAAADAETAWRAYLDVFGDEPVAWDVLLPTQRELPPPWTDGTSKHQPLPHLVRHNDAHRALLQAFPAHVHAAFAEHLETALKCVARGEDDDWLYARLQCPVRVALLHLGRSLKSRDLIDHADDVFFVSLGLAQELAAAQHAPGSSLRRIIAEAKALHVQREQNPPPAPNTHDLPLRGHGTAGRAVGKVRLYREGVRFLDPTAVVVARSLLPTDLPLVQAAAFVMETGGTLDHVAAQARERNIPTIVGVANVTARLREGELVLVDADAGVVVRLSGAP